MTSPRHRHPKNCPDSEAMRDFAWGATRSFKPLHKICDFDLMLDAHIREDTFTKPNRFSIPSTHSFFAMPRGPARRPRTVKTRFILSETRRAAPSLCGGSVDSRPIVLKTKLSFLKSAQGTVHIFCEHLSPGDAACHPKPKYLPQMEGNPCDAGATIWRTTAA